MALVNCAECGREISDVATTCPQCGAPGPGLVRQALAANASRATWSAGCTLAIAVPLVLGILYALLAR